MSEHPFVAMLRQQAENNEPPQFPQWEAQLDTLREVHALVDDVFPQVFLRGDIVRHVAQTGPLVKVKPDGMCLMFWRMLDPEAVDDQRRIEVLNPAMLMIYDGSCIHFHLGSTALLKRDPRQNTVNRQ